MKVFRIVHLDTGNGPYISQGDVCNINDNKDIFWVDDVITTKYSSSPEPEQDELFMANYDVKYPNADSKIHSSSYIFAFTSLEQAFKWFGDTGVQKMMHWYGFSLLEKDIPDEDVIVGDT